MRWGRKEGRKQVNKEASKQASKQASKETNKQTSKHLQSEPTNYSQTDDDFKLNQKFTYNQKWKYIAQEVLTLWHGEKPALE